METQKFKPVELVSINQGKFSEECEEVFNKAQHGLVAFVEEQQKQVSAEGTVTVKINIRFDAKKDAYYILTDIGHKPPKKPTRVTTAFVAVDENGELGLWSQRFGTGKGDPKQQLLCDEEGHTAAEIDTSESHKL